MRSIIIRRGFASEFAKFFVSFSELRQSIRRLSAHRQRKVAKRFRFGEIENARIVVCDHPRENRVLHQIVVGSTRPRVQNHQIFEIRDFPVFPLFGESVHHLTRIGRSRLRRVLQNPLEGALPLVPLKSEKISSPVREKQFQPDRLKKIAPLFDVSDLIQRKFIHLNESEKFAKLSSRLA